MMALLFPVLLLLWFGFAWWGFSWITSRVGGWHALARAYRVEDAPTAGNFLTGANGDVGISRYRSRLVVGVTPAGLSLAIRPRLFPGHPPLLIPWEAVIWHGHQQKYWRDCLVLTVQVRGGQGTQELRSLRFLGADLIALVEDKLATLPPPPPAA